MTKLRKAIQSYRRSWPGAILPRPGEPPGPDYRAALAHIRALSDEFGWRAVEHELSTARRDSGNAEPRRLPHAREASGGGI